MSIPVVEEFGQIVSTLSHDGRYMFFLKPPRRAILTTPDLFQKFMLAAEDVLGFNGAKVIMYTTGYNITKEMGEKIRASQNATIEEAFTSYIANTKLRGFGNITVLSEDFHNGNAVIEMTGSIFVEPYKAKGEPVCHFYAGALAGMMATFRGKKATGKEVACEAAGSSVCRFEITSV